MDSGKRGKKGVGGGLTRRVEKKNRGKCKVRERRNYFKARREKGKKV